MTGSKTTESQRKERTVARTLSRDLRAAVRSLAELGNERLSATFSRGELYYMASLSWALPCRTKRTCVALYMGALGMSPEDAEHEVLLQAAGLLQLFVPSRGPTPLSYVRIYLYRKCRRDVDRQAGAFAVAGRKGSLRAFVVITSRNEPFDSRARAPWESSALAEFPREFDVVADGLQAEWVRVIRDRACEDLTLEEIGRRKGVTRERVRQIETRSLEILGWRLRRFRSLAEALGLALATSPACPVPPRTVDNIADTPRANVPVKVARTSWSSLRE